MSASPDLVIRGGSIADGLGGELFEADGSRLARSLSSGARSRDPLALPGRQFLRELRLRRLAH